jgi:hypothetical protein
MNTNAPAPDRFEDRLLTAILDDFDHLTADVTPPAALSLARYRRARHAHPARRAVPALVAGAAVAALAVTVATVGTHGSNSVTLNTAGRAPTPGGVPATGSQPPATAVTPSAVGHSSTHAVLYRLASLSADAPAPQGRYVVLAETDTATSVPGQSQRTTVVDTQTGASTTYQEPYPGSKAPATLTEGPDPTSTEAWFAALPTDPTALRAQLLSIAKQQAAEATQQFQQQAAAAGKAVAPGVEQPALSDDDYVYEEADLLLWSPLVQPVLRSALYKVLAGTSGIVINPTATDPAGRPAVAMTRHDDGVPSTSTTYEDPSSGAVLAQVWTQTWTNSEQQSASETETAVYQPVTSTDTMPSDPYPA